MLCLAIQKPSQLTLLRPPLAQTLHNGTGILTCYPSPTPIGLGLGSTNPERINLSHGNLRHTANRNLTYFSLLIPTYSLLSSITCLSSQARIYERTLPYPIL